MTVAVWFGTSQASNFTPSRHQRGLPPRVGRALGAAAALRRPAGSPLSLLLHSSWETAGL